MIGAIYGLQILIFLFRGKWDMIGWMVFYILAIPIFSFYLPLYSFWAMDDFSWGNTRVVVGESGKKLVVHVSSGSLPARGSVPKEELTRPTGSAWVLTGRGQVRPKVNPSQVVERVRERAVGQGVEPLGRKRAFPLPLSPFPFLSANSDIRFISIYSGSLPPKSP